MMERLKDWEKRLAATVERHRNLPSQYGVSDCYMITADAIEAVTGEKIFPGSRNYKTVSGAGKQLRKRGFENVEQALASILPDCAVLTARRGDVGVVERGGEISGGVFTAIGFMTRGDGALIYLPVTEVKRAFRVG